MRDRESHPRQLLHLKLRLTQIIVTGRRLQTSVNEMYCLTSAKSPANKLVITHMFTSAEVALPYLECCMSLVICMMRYHCNQIQQSCSMQLCSSALYCSCSTNISPCSGNTQFHWNVLQFTSKYSFDVVPSIFLDCFSKKKRVTEQKTNASF